MRLRAQFQLPDDKQEQLRKASRLEWITIGFLLSITVVMFLVMGSSQAMKTAWIEDVLSLVPPISFLIAARYRSRPPTQRFPYGFRRADDIAFLCAATALTLLGLYMIYDSAMKLIMAEHPSIGLITLFGHTFWMGWAMIAALVYSAIPPVILGRMKQPLAKDLHEKTLHTDADMNKADWMTALAGILGILGIGIGWWWADGVAAGFISLNVFKDGITNLQRVVYDLMNKRPSPIDDNTRPHHVIEELRRAMKELPWTLDADVRLHEEGHVFSGEVFIVPRELDNLPEKLQEAADRADAVDWRLHGLVVTVVPSLDEPEGEAVG